MYIAHKIRNMKSKLYIENLLLLELSPSIKLSKLQNIRAALTKTNLMESRKNIDAYAAAWALFAATGCPYARYPQIVQWLEDRKADMTVNHENNHPLNHLAFLFSSKEARDRVQVIGFSPQGLVNIVFTDGTNILTPKKTAKKITSQVHDFTFVPGELFCSIADTVGLSQKKLA